MKKSILLVMILTFFSCDIPYINNLYGSDNISTFNYYCDQFKKHYVYMELKGKDIEILRSAYLDKFTNNSSKEEFFSVLSDFTNEFQDGHANIMAPFGYSSAYSQIINDSANYNPNYNSSVIKYNYLNNCDILGYSLKNGIIETSDGKYGYIYYGSFTDSFTKYNVEYILNRFINAGVKGIILDIRSNGGGALNYSQLLVSYFGYNVGESSTEALKVWRRDGINEYTQIYSLVESIGSTIPFTISRNENGYTGKVALLTNAESYSASSFTAALFLAYNNVKSFGQNTGGGMGIPYGGILPNDWTYRFSSNIAMDYRATSYTGSVNSGYNYESTGVPVDFSLIDNPDTTDKDEIIDGAISWINLP